MCVLVSIGGVVLLQVFKTSEPIIFYAMGIGAGGILQTLISIEE